MYEYLVIFSVADFGQIHRLLPHLRNYLHLSVILANLMPLELEELVPLEACALSDTLRWLLCFMLCPRMWSLILRSSCRCFGGSLRLMSKLLIGHPFLICFFRPFLHRCPP